MTQWRGLIIKITTVFRRFFLCLGLIIASTLAEAQQEIRILVLMSLDVTYPYVKSKVDGLAYEGARSPESVILDIQTLEDRRFNNPEQLHQFYSQKARQFAISKPDVIAVTGSPVIFSFYNQYVYPLMPDVPMVGETRITPPDHKPEAYSFIEYHQNMPRTIEMALQLSKPRTVYLIGDATHPGSVLGMDLVEQNFPADTGVTIKRLDMPFAELIDSLPHLPRDAVGFYNLIFSDGQGRLMVPETALATIAESAPFPIYAFHETMVGSGATGGIVAKGEDVGIAMVKESLTALFVGPFQPPRIVPAPSTALFDWHYLDRFGINPDHLPADAEMLNRQPRVLDVYFVEIIATLIVITMQAILVSMLVIYARQKRQLSNELKAVNLELEDRIDERTAQLVNANEKLVRKEKEITHLMLTDPLTNIPNRRCFEDEVSREFSRSERSNNDFCIGICDIDFFKQVNDDFGHDVGDQILVEVADTIQSTIRHADFVARWGGEEFVIMFIESDVESAYAIGERVRKKVRKLIFKGVDRPVTISIGLAQRHAGDQFRDLFKRADNALYTAKREGRDQVRQELASANK